MILRNCDKRRHRARAVVWRDRDTHPAPLASVVALMLAVAMFMAGPTGEIGAAFGQTQGQVPGETRGETSDSELWRMIRAGNVGSVSIPNDKAGLMIQSAGESWRSVRNGPLSTYGVWAMSGMVGLLAIFFLLRGRVRIGHGPAGTTIERFNGIERFAHWLTAGSFIVLALTGLNLLYGRYVLLPVLGADAFSALTLYGKLAHNYLAFAFMFGIILMFVLWVKDNIPSSRDIGWLLKGGGLVGGGHPDAKKFNAGQKIIFWLVILGGSSVSLSGLSLMFPFELPMFANTFAFINGIVGTSYPDVMTPLQEMQYATAWHGIVGLVLITVILAHVYIGSVGMEGAFAAMGSGQVDVNWAKEHHNLWVADVKARQGDNVPAAQPVGGHD